MAWTAGSSGSLQSAQRSVIFCFQTDLNDGSLTSFQTFSSKHYSDVFVDVELTCSALERNGTLQLWTAEVEVEQCVYAAVD